MKFLEDHGTKILGGITSLLGALASLIAMDAFDKLLSETAIGWLNIIVALATATVGGLTLGRGFNNSAQVKIATAMETAIKSQPPGAPNA